MCLISHNMSYINITWVSSVEKSLRRRLSHCPIRLFLHMLHQYTFNVMFMLKFRAEYKLNGAQGMLGMDIKGFIHFHL